MILSHFSPTSANFNSALLAVGAGVGFVAGVASATVTVIAPTVATVWAPTTATSVCKFLPQVEAGSISTI